MKFLSFVMALLIGAGSVMAQPQRKQDGKQRHMGDEERQRMREDIRGAYRDRRERPERPRQMTDAEREKLRRDIEETNRQLRRK